MLILNTNWSDAFTVMGLGLLIVFIVLVLLVFLLNFSGWIFNRKNKKSAIQEEVIPTSSTSDELSDNEKAAIAMGLYLFYEDVHDKESYVITIDEPKYQSTWNSKMYNLNNIV